MNKHCIVTHTGFNIDTNGRIGQCCLQKKEYLLKEHPDNLPLMRSIKRSLDQNNIMNPGKVFDLN